MSFPVFFTFFTLNTLALLFAATPVPARKNDALIARIAADTLEGNPGQADAWRLLGDIHFMMDNYGVSARCYERAYALCKKPGLKIPWARSAFNNGENARAISLLKTTLSEHSGPVAARASYYLGTIYRRQNNHSRALDCYSRAISEHDTAAWYASALAGHYLSAINMGFTGKAQKSFRELEEKFPGFLEQSIVDSAHNTEYRFAHDDFSAALISSRPVKPEPSQPPQAITDKKSGGTAISTADTLFTIQVGSFGSQDNAASLAKRLKELFDDVRVVQAQVEENVYYRVQIGQFESREHAEQYARDRVKETYGNYKILRQ